MNIFQNMTAEELEKWGLAAPYEVEECKNGYVYRPDDLRSLYVKVAESAFYAYDAVHDEQGRETRRYKDLPKTGLTVRLCVVANGKRKRTVG